MIEEITLSQRPKCALPDDEIVGRLAGGVAHYFNNMLLVILGNTELALDELDKDKIICTGLKEIRKAAERLADMTQKLLTCAGKQLIAQEQLDINQIIEITLKSLRENNRLRINFEWLPGTGLWKVKADPFQFNQILNNLYENAIESIEGPGRIVIETGNRSFCEKYCLEHGEYLPGEYAWITVSDNGCGMDQETMSHLFEPFFTTKEVGKGTGLGLAIVYGAIKQNNGFINICSAQGKGTTITVYLPRDNEKCNAGAGQTATEPKVSWHGASLGRASYSVEQMTNNRRTLFKE